MAHDAAKRINDSIYGNINVSEQELRLIDTPTFQRLHQIRQLGAANLVYPGATHTRFAHCIGTMHMMSQFLHALKRSREKRERETDMEKLRIAALLHDIGHYPYSHTLEKAVKRLGGMAHEEFGRYLLKKFLSDKLDTYRADEISDLFSGGKGYASPIISSALDADKSDYLIRDSYHCGVPYGRVSIQRLVRTMSYVKSGIVFEKDEISAEDFLIGRYHMYRAVYHHKTVTSFNLMVERIYENMVMEGYMTSPKDLANEDDEYSITNYTDDMLFASMHKYLESGTGRFTKSLIKLFLAREPLECVYINPQPAQKGIVPEEAEKIKRLETSESERSRLADMAGMKPEDIFVVSLRPLSLIDEQTNVYIRNKGKLKPITESSGLVLNMIGSKTLHDARIYAIPGSGRKLAKALGSYLKKG